MRVTEKTIFDSAAKSAGVLRERMQKAVDENATGLKNKHPWDDPGVTAPLIGHRLSVIRQEAMASTSEGATDELVAADGALAAVIETVSRAHELAIQLSSDNYGRVDRNIAAEQVRALFNDAVGMLNTRVGNRYIFAGFQDDQPAYNQAGVYQGDSGVRQVEAFPGVMQNVSMPGDAIARGASGGPDILGTLTALETALMANDVVGVQNTLDLLDDSIEHISLARTNLGAAWNTLGIGIESNRNNVVTEKANISRLAEADVFESATKLALAQRALEASLTASARSFDLTLIHKL